MYASKDVVNEILWGGHVFLHKNKLVSLKIGFERKEELPLSKDFEK